MWDLSGLDNTKQNTRRRGCFLHVQSKGHGDWLSNWIPDQWFRVVIAGFLPPHYILHQSAWSWKGKQFVLLQHRNKSSMLHTWPGPHTCPDFNPQSTPAFSRRAAPCCIHFSPQQGEGDPYKGLFIVPTHPVPFCSIYAPFKFCKRRYDLCLSLNCSSHMSTCKNWWTPSKGCGRGHCIAPYRFPGFAVALRLRKMPPLEEAGPLGTISATSCGL